MNQQANIDPSEIEKFDAMAANWWDPNGPMKPLHQLNPLRIHYIQQHAELSEKKILDIGCGAGILSESLAEAGAEVTGIDLSRPALDVARTHAQSQQLTIDYQDCAAETLAAQSPQTYDVITCMELLEHVPNPAELIQSCSTLIKPNGIIFFSTVNRSVKAYLTAIVGAEYILQMLPKGTHHYDKFIRPSELAEWAREADLSLTHLQGVSYQPLSGYFKLSNDVSVNYMVCYRHNPHSPT